jgi:hypothetical protein
VESIIMNLQESMRTWQADSARNESLGIVLPEVKAYIPDEFRFNSLAMDAQPTLFTTANSGVPTWLTMYTDPEIVRILYTPNIGAEILGESKRGTWIDTTWAIQMMEITGEVSTYGDYTETGRTGLNTQWEYRQNYIYQTMIELGDREIEMAGLAKLNYVSEINNASVVNMDKFLNFSYFFGIQGLQNFGLLNDPSLSAAITPSTKSQGGTRWMTAGNAPNATPNEVYNDVQTLVTQLVTQTAGLVNAASPMALAMSPQSAMAINSANSFGVSTKKLLNENFPNIRIEPRAVQYAAQSAQNPQGNLAGNLLQLIATSVEGQKTGFCAFSDKMRASPMIRATSSYKQKYVAGTWGAIIKVPMAIASMVGV